MGMETDAKGYVSEKDRDGVFKTQLCLLENRTCFDCDAPNPSWLSLSFAIYLCLNCSGRHRQMGTHVSFVRSIDMDKFTVEQLARMTSGGNKRAKIYFDSKGIPRNSHGYSSKAAAIYKLLLDGDKTKIDSIDTSKIEGQDKKKIIDDDWFDQKMKSITPAKKLGARQIDNSEFDNLFTKTNPAVCDTNYPPFSYVDGNSEFMTPPPSNTYSTSTPHHQHNPYGGHFSSISNAYATNSFGDSSTFRTNTRVSNRENNDYWPAIEETAQNNIHELKEGIKYIISKGNVFYDKARNWFNNI